jgi:23S rRNA (pseudouridine1915-N3)-methyltransferase
VGRLRRYAPVEVQVAPEAKGAKSLSARQQVEREGEAIIALSEGSELLLLDERGEALSSEELAAFLSKKMLGTSKAITFAVGGPYGFSEKVYRRAAGMISLSRMTFSHQMVRLFLVEQLYRAFTIMKGEPYHHKSAVAGATSFAAAAGRGQ